MQRLFRSSVRRPSFRNGVVGLNVSFTEADLLISPAYDGKTSWSFIADGPLNIGTYGEYTITPLRDFTVTSKMWGAGGARGWSYSAAPSSYLAGPGGGGGYSTATIVMRAGVNYILQAGQGGARTTARTPIGATYLAGGVGLNATYGGTQGGGYSGIFKSSVTQGNALLMAGGGGGGGDTSYSSDVGAGGGSSGASAVNGGQGGGPGTQLAGGSGSYNSASIGTALTGGRGQSDDTGASLGGGGGGYFGGGGGNVGGGGGGSGRIGTDADVSGGSTAVGSSDIPANSSDADRNGAGRGGNSTGDSGTDGRIILTLVP